MANFCLGVFFNLSIWYKLTHKTYWGAYLTIFGAVITLIGNFVFIPQYGYMACAWTTLICYACMMLCSFLVGNKFYEVKYDIRRFFGYTFLALGLWLTSKRFEIASEALNLAVKNALLILFLIIVFIFERKKLTLK
jgi:O-antigen/teichoic acid export membrane protein